MSPSLINVPGVMELAACENRGKKQRRKKNGNRRKKSMIVRVRIMSLVCFLENGYDKNRVVLEKEDDENEVKLKTKNFQLNVALKTLE